MSPAQLRILVPLEDPHQEHNLVDLAATLAPSPWGELHLTHILTPDAEPIPGYRPITRKLSADRAMARNIGAIAHLEEGAGRNKCHSAGRPPLELQHDAHGLERQMSSETAILSAPNRALTKDTDVDTLIFKEKEAADR